MDFNSIYNQILSISLTKYKMQIKNRTRFIWDKVSPLINPNTTVAEIGVGPMSILAKQLKKAEVIGVDLTNSWLSLCDKFKIDLKLCDVQVSPLPLEDSSLDVIFLLEVVEHLCMYPNDLFDEIAKKLKPGGYLILTTPNLLRFSNRLRVIFGKNPMVNYFEKTSDGSNHIREFLPDEMAYYLKKSGFKIVKKEFFGTPYGHPSLKALLRLIYLYPNFRNYFLIIGKK